jgi:hypothetical protein
MATLTLQADRTCIALQQQYKLTDTKRRTKYTEEEEEEEEQSIHNKSLFGKLYFLPPPTVCLTLSRTIIFFLSWPGARKNVSISRTHLMRLGLPHLVIGPSKVNQVSFTNGYREHQVKLSHGLAIHALVQNK